jgi:hypothetical protein
MIIQVQNNLTDLAQSTYLSAAGTASGTVLPVKNISTFPDDWAVQIGATGLERSEIKILAGTAAGSLNLAAALSYDHPTDTPVYAVKYDQVVFLRSTAGTAGTATALSNGTVSITPDSLVTQLDDTSGASNYAYKTQFRNSQSGDVSSESDWLTPSGFNWYSLANIRNRVKSKLFDSGFIEDNSNIDGWINEYYEMMNVMAVDANEDYALGTVDVSFGTAGLGTITSADFLFPTRIWITTDGGVNFYQATKQSANSYQPSETFNQTAPYVSFQGDTVFEVRPSDLAGSARIQYQKLFTPLSSDADELPMYMRNFTSGFVNYGLAQALKTDNKYQEAQTEEGRAQQRLNDFQSKIVPRLRTGGSSIEIVEPISGEDF